MPKCSICGTEQKMDGIFIAPHGPDQFAICPGSLKAPQEPSKEERIEAARENQEQFKKDCLKHVRDAILTKRNEPDQISIHDLSEREFREGVVFVLGQMLFHQSTDESVRKAHAKRLEWIENSDASLNVKSVKRSMLQAIPIKLRRLFKEDKQ